MNIFQVGLGGGLSVAVGTHGGEKCGDRWGLLCQKPGVGEQRELRLIQVHVVGQAKSRPTYGGVPSFYLTAAPLQAKWTRRHGATAVNNKKCQQSTASNRLLGIPLER